MLWLLTALLKMMLNFQQGPLRLLTCRSAVLILRAVCQLCFVSSWFLTSVSLQHQSHVCRLLAQYLLATLDISKVLSARDLFKVFIVSSSSHDSFSVFYFKLVVTFTHEFAFFLSKRV